MFSIPSYHKSLLNWYAMFQRHLPWRMREGEIPDPYKVWISEIMLQQTTVPTVKDYYLRFVEKWPTISHLAKAPLDDVLHAWQGLGYYSRARNLHKCAQVVWAEHEGIFPSEESDLLKLPGIGPYTAAAIRSIAFNQTSTVVDGNIERIMARLFQIQAPLPQAKKEIYYYAEKLKSDSAPADYAQALMDLGSMVCTPKSPKCDLCPLQAYCQSVGNKPENFPKRLPKNQRPIKYATFFFVENDQGDVLIERRPEKGLLAGMMGFPTSNWTETLSAVDMADEVIGKIQHTFTHFHLVGTVVRKSHHSDGIWVKREDLHKYALPTLMKKVKKVIFQEAE